MPGSSSVIDFRRLVEWAETRAEIDARRLVLIGFSMRANVGSIALTNDPRIGFGVLVVSGITMLRDFGFVTIVDLSVSLAGVMLVLPATLVWAESGFRPFPAILGRLRRSPGGGVQPTAASKSGPAA